MMGAMMKIKSALVGLVLGGLSAMTIRDWPALASPSIETLIRQVERASRYRAAFNGRLPSVKQAQRQAKAKRATRRARRLGHA